MVRWWTATPVPAGPVRRHRSHHPRVRIVVASVDRGSCCPGQVAVLAESDVSGRRRPTARPGPARPVDGFFDDLAPGSYVVHRQHGVARYGGMVTRTMGGATRTTCCSSTGAGTSCTCRRTRSSCSPPTSAGLATVSRWAARSGRSPGPARAAVHEIAEDLVDLYASAPGGGACLRRRHALAGGDGGSFGFVETSDQARAIDEVKADMERPLPMDRLVCGDVGFGKTEVAVRASSRRPDGRQAACWCPPPCWPASTSRPSPSATPYRAVELLSRFLTNAQARVVLDGLADGSVDVVVGPTACWPRRAVPPAGPAVWTRSSASGCRTRRPSRPWRRVDVLTLTASPIPGPRDGAHRHPDLSMVNTPRPPAGPSSPTWGVRGAAVSRPSAGSPAGGQVFYVHNRVQDIDAVAERVRRLAPRPGWPWPRADGRGTLEKWSSTSGRGL